MSAKGRPERELRPPGGSEGAKPRAWGEHAGLLHVFEILGNAISGGMETSVVRLVREWPRDRFRVSALCPFESHITQALRDAGADVLIAPVRDDPPWGTVQLAASYAQDENVDVVHAHLANAHVLAALVSGLTDRPTLATIHGRAVPMLDLEAHRSSERMHMSVVCRAAYRHARAIGVAREHLHFVPNGVPVVQAPLAGGALAASLGVAADAPLVGFVGRLSPEKAPDVFVRMAAQLADRQSRPAFVVVGDGPMRERAIDCARSLGIRERIHFVGERHDVPALLPSLAALVVPSHAEGMPLALMEAMAAGVPVVATSVGGIPELVRHDETGLLVDDGDVSGFAAAVDRLLDDRAWASGLGARAREWALAHWPQHESAMRMGGLLTRIAAGGRAPPSPHAGSAARMRLAGRAVDARSDP